uniref:Protein kinase domain-containing protein n=1 Tax=Macrostomum lignano TaxID=282301 RepID=A0A1I8JHZ4_9PLAT
MHRNALVQRASRQQRMYKKTKEEIEQAYTLGQQLGEGGFGKVYQAIDNKTGMDVAIKILNKKQVHQRNMGSRLYSYFEDADSVYLVLELCHRGSLHDYVRQQGRVSEDQVRYFMRQIVTGLRYLHQNRIIHRDLTLANLLLTKDNKVKISDFGLATEIADGRTNKTMCGTPNYISPEVSGSGVQGVEVDVWSLGVMLYTLLVGKAPFDTKDPKSTIDNARRLRYDIPGNLDADAIDLIAKLIRERPQDRIKLTDILEHSFLKKGGGFDAVDQSRDSGTDSTQSWHSSNHQPQQHHQHQHQHPNQSPSPVLMRRHASAGQLRPHQQHPSLSSASAGAAAAAASAAAAAASAHSADAQQRRCRSSSQSCQQNCQHPDQLHHQQQHKSAGTPRYHKSDSQGYVTQSDRSPLACSHSQQQQQRPQVQLQCTKSAVAM